MENSDLIKEFSTHYDLKDEIDNDLKDNSPSANRFPIRFIFLNSHDELKEIVDLIGDNVKKIELSSLLKSDSSWFTNDELFKKIENINENSLILPISEYLRFNSGDSFREFLSKLAEIEKDNIRIYIPIIGLWEQFNQQFWKYYFRKDNWAPIWKLNTESEEIKIYQVEFEFNEDKIQTNEFKVISKSKEWFELWKINNNKKIISLVKPLGIFPKLPDKTFDLEFIETPQDYLDKIYGIKLDIEYKTNEEKYWNKLLSYVSKQNKKNLSLKTIVADEFNIHNFDKVDLEKYLKYYLNNTKNNYKQWLIKNLFLNLNKFKDSYLHHCFEITERLNVNDLAENIFLEIFNEDYNEEHLTERKNLLRMFDYDFSKFEEEFKRKLDHIDLNNIQKMKYLTENSSFEKEMILNIGQNECLSDSYLFELKSIFPDLYHYLNWSLFSNNDWIYSYFKEYNKSKVLNSKSTILNELLIENNNPEEFYKWYYEIPNIQKQEIKQNDYVVWIDGLGVEWLPLLTYYLKEFCDNDKKIASSINSVYIPSITKFNKIHANKEIRKLDKYIHDNHYKYPNSLIEEIDMIKDFAKEISKLGLSYGKIHIVSDHGFSFLCTKEFGCLKKYDFDKSEHEGRYLLNKSNSFNDTEDYICTKSESCDEEYVVTLTHTSLYNTPSHEVHGGATPEEILVPHITIENKAGTFDNFKLTCDTTDINISVDNELIISINPKPSELPIASYNTSNLKVSKQTANDYIIYLSPDMRTGKCKIIMNIDGEEKELDINIKKGGMEEEEYDFG